MPPLEPNEARKVAERRHPEWTAWEVRWRWLLDSLVGGDRYRYACYGHDSRGLPRRNLIRHKREYPSEGESLADYLPQPGSLEATQDDYLLRLARTPVPDVFAEVVHKHLSKVYRREVERDGPQAYTDWTQDVDGRGTSVDDWMRDEVAPLLKTYGCVDVIADHPPAPDGEEIATEADRLRLGLGRVETRVVHPTDVTWWRLDRQGRYTEVVIRETAEEIDDRTGQAKEVTRYRRWDADSWTLIERDRIVASGSHPYGRPPVVRLFHKRHPCHRHVGMPPLEGVAERMRELYNRDSELILSDTVQAHPLLQGPEDYTTDGQVPIGPGWLLPKKKDTTGGKATYEGFEVVDFPKGGAESIRANKGDLRDAIDRAAGLLKPAGAMGGGPVAQSGVSKSYDHDELNAILSDDADTLAAAETAIGRLVVWVAADGQASDGDLDAVTVRYDKRFDLIASADLLAGLQEVQLTLSGAGRLPEAESRVLYAAIAQLLPGLTEQEYDTLWQEVQAAVAKADAERKMAAQAMAQPQGPDAGPDGEPPEDAGEPEPEPDAEES